MPAADLEAAEPAAAIPNQSTEDIPIERIVVDHQGRRALNEAVVADLMQSILRRGLLHAIIVTPIADSQQFGLVAGWHRYEACKQLGHERIKSVRLDTIDEATRKEIEIVENLVRAELSEADRCSQLLELKKIYEGKHPEIRKGGQGGGRAGKGTRRRTGSDKLSFSASVAAKTGESKRSVERRVRRAKQLGEEDIKRIKGTSLESPAEMDALIALPDEERARLVECAAKGDKVSAAARAAVIDKGNKAAIASTARNGAGEPIATEHAQPILAVVARAEVAISELLTALNKSGASGELKALSEERRNALVTALSVVHAKVAKSLG